MIRRWWRWVAGAVALVIVVAGAPSVLRRMDVFTVRRIDAVGSVYLTAEEIARIAKVPPEANIFDDTEPFRRRVLAVRGIAQVKVRRRLPGALVFEIEEFPAVALAPSQGRLALIDRRGRVLPFDPARAPVDLPIAEADSAVAGLIDRIGETDPALSGAVTTASRQKSTIVLETDKHRLLFRVGATTKDIQGAAAVISELARRNMRVAEVDARFEGRVIVRGRGR